MAASVACVGNDAPEWLKCARWAHPGVSVRSTSMSSMVVLSLLELNDGIDLDHCGQGKRGDADCGSRMPAGFAKDGDDEIGGAIGHFRMSGEVCRGGHEYPEAQEPADGRDLSGRDGSDLSKEFQRRRTGG